MAVQGARWGSMCRWGDIYTLELSHWVQWPEDKKGSKARVREKGELDGLTSSPFSPLWEHRRQMDWWGETHRRYPTTITGTHTSYEV